MVGKNQVYPANGPRDLIDWVCIDAPRLLDYDAARGGLSGK
jgi:hypothetical protein